MSKRSEYELGVGQRLAQQHTKERDISGPKTPFEKTLKIFSDSSAKNAKLVHAITTVITGFIFGFTVAIGLGLSRQTAFFSGILVAFGTFVARSFVAYLVFQTLSLTILAITAYSVFRLAPSTTFDQLHVQVFYLAVVFLSPFLSLVPKMRLSTARLSEFVFLQLVAVVSFALLVRNLRVSRPSDPNFALSQMYGAEDNAGVIAVLAKSLTHGYSSHASLFGEFFNGIYLTVAGLISWFGDPKDLELVAALTHWNVSTLLLAWAPLAVMVAIVFSGKKLLFFQTIVSFLGATALAILLFWPFINLGHSSVISSGLVAICLLSLTLNRDLSKKHPLFLLSAATALGSIIAISWFPLMPFTAACIALFFVSLLVTHPFENNKKVFLGLVGIFLASAAFLLPGALTLSADSGTYLAMPGGTRAIGEPLILTWLALAAVGFWTISRKQRKGIFGQGLFLAVFLLLFASNLYLFLSGLANNAGQPGYGALKYMMTSIAFSLPFLFLILLMKKPKIDPLTALFTGVTLILAVITFQYDSRPVGSSFVSPAQPANVAAAQSGVFLAIEEALSKKPQHIICVTDLESHSVEAEQNTSAYLCTRWSQSLVGDESGQEWRFVPLGRLPEESLIPVLDDFRDKNVVVIRFSDPDEPLSSEGTWWFKYIDASWEIISVP